MAKKPKKRDWLEPPEWWRKWKPLRWVAGGIVLISIFSWIRAYWESKPIPVEHEQRERVAVVRQPTAPVEAPPAEAAPAEAPTPAPQASAPVPQDEPQAAPLPVEPPLEERPVEEPPVEEPPVVEAPPVEPAPSETRAEPGANPDLIAYTRIEPQRAPFLEPFRSYDSLERVRQALAEQEYEPDLSTHSVRVPEDIPPYAIDRVSVKPYSHLGVEGALRMELFNDRLYEVEFEPGDPEAYLKALRKRIPELRQSGKGRVEFTQGPLRVASTLDLAISDVGRALRTRPYVLWQDTRLLQQRDEWDPKYAREAVH